MGLIQSDTALLTRRQASWIGFNGASQSVFCVFRASEKNILSSTCGQVYLGAPGHCRHAKYVLLPGGGGGERGWRHGEAQSPD